MSLSSARTDNCIRRASFMIISRQYTIPLLRPNSSIIFFSYLSPVATAYSSKEMAAFLHSDRWQAWSSSMSHNVFLIPRSQWYNLSFDLARFQLLWVPILVLCWALKSAYHSLESQSTFGILELPFQSFPTWGILLRNCALFYLELDSSLFGTWNLISCLVVAIAVISLYSLSRKSWNATPL